MGIGAEIFFFYGSILMSQWVSNLSTLPSRVPRRASRVRGILLFCGFVLASKPVSNLSTLPSRVPRRASRVPGHSSFLWFCPRVNAGI